MDPIATLTYEPLKLCRQNPIVVNIDAAPLTITVRSGLRYYLELYLPINYQSTTFEKVETLEASEEPPYQIAGAWIVPGAYVEIQQHIDSFLSSTLPSFGQKNISVCESLTVPYYYKSIVKNNGIVISESTSSTFWAYKGGISMNDYADYKDLFFTYFIGNKKRFLTYAKNPKTVLPSSPEFLYFIVNFSPLPSAIHLRIMLKYDDDSTEILTARSFSQITAYTVYGFPVGPVALDLEAMPKIVISYNCWVANQDFEQISEIRTYIIDSDYRRNIKHILFSNSLSVFENITCLGANSEKLSVERTSSERYVGFDYLPSFSEKVISLSTGERQLIVSTGWILKSENEHLSELFLSREIFVMTDRAYLPLLLLNQDIKVNANDDTLIAQTLTFSYTKPEHNYSRLPIAPAVTVQLTGWRMLTLGDCLSDANGIRTGQRAVSFLEKYYLSTNQAVRPQVVKPNIPGTDGYIATTMSGQCTVTPFLNVAIIRQGTHLRSVCPSGFVGATAIITIAAQIYGSEISQADADAKAEAAFARADTQAYADQNGACVIPFYNAAISQMSTIAKANCDANFTGQKWLINIPANVFMSGLSQADADAKALAEYHRLDTQLNANNSNAECLYTPTTYQRTIPAGQWWSIIVIQNPNNYPLQGPMPAFYDVNWRTGTVTRSTASNDCGQALPLVGLRLNLASAYPKNPATCHVKIWKNSVVIYDADVIFSEVVYITVSDQDRIYTEITY
jgi:Family of unknown function (DUF5977)